MPWTPPPEPAGRPVRPQERWAPRPWRLKTEGQPPPPKPPGGLRVEDRDRHPGAGRGDLGDRPRPGRWSEWNPTYPSAGPVRIGESLEVTLALPGQPPQVIRPKVLDWQPPTQLHWQLKLLGGLIRTLRYIEIEALGETAAWSTTANCSAA